ncbi:MAG: tRNA lysidine(34) synthetase TilS [Spirochaetes bacterium]|nr:tRNA lysidine(34) synthetase TilS [Spirochaetota bacterium]
MIKEGDSILLSVSAGKDSVFLLNYMKYIQADLNLDLHAFHLNHLTRGKESDDDMDFITDLCKKLEINLHVESFDFGGIKENFENAARQKRYTFLDKYRSEFSLNKIATAHTQSDDTETVLYRIFRGTSIHGLQGIRPVRDHFIRPMLCLRKDEVLNFLSSEKIQWREDATNAENHHDRNYIRNIIIPQLEKRFSIDASIQNLKNSAVNASNLIQTVTDTIDYKFIDDRVEIEYSDKLTDKPFYYYFISGIIRNFFKTDVTNCILDESYRNIIITERKNNIILYSGPKLTIAKKHRNSKKVIIITHNPPEKQPYWEYDITTGEKLPFEAAAGKFSLSVKRSGYKSFLANNNSSVLFINGDNINKIKIRQKLDGDKIEMNGKSVRLKKIMINNKLDNNDKLLLPVVESGGIIIGLIFRAVSSSCNRVSDSFKVDSNTKKILAIYCNWKIM